MDASWLRAFLLTVFSEGALGAVLGLRTRRELAALAAANLVTHPALYFLAAHRLPAALWANDSTGLLLLEAGAILAEAALLHLALPYRRWSQLLTLSLLMNLGSFLFGAAFLWRP
jgi:hypothetical protein